MLHDGENGARRAGRRSMFAAQETRCGWTEGGDYIALGLSRQMWWVKAQAREVMWCK